jgi:acetolactate synthase-1/2/3 large subunit
LSGAARGLLGATAPPAFRHERKVALREADLVVIAGVPCDFRLGYGRAISSRARIIAIDLERKTRRLNRRPDIEVRADAGLALVALAGSCRSGGARWAAWIDKLSERDRSREAEIEEQAANEDGALGPLSLLRTLDQLLDEKSVIVGDGGDFVGTAAYTLSPRAPLSWLDPGPFGTLGCGGGFALAAKRARADAEVWLLLGDGSSAFSLAELDTMARHGLGVVAIVGNDSCWSQIARDQVRLLGSATGTELASCDYEMVAEGFGARGLVIEHRDHARERLEEARDIARTGTPVLVNARIARSTFREGSISI